MFLCFRRTGQKACWRRSLKVELHLKPFFNEKTSYCGCRTSSQSQNEPLTGLLLIETTFFFSFLNSVLLFWNDARCQEAPVLHLIILSLYSDPEVFVFFCKLRKQVHRVAADRCLFWWNSEGEAGTEGEAEETRWSECRRKRDESDEKC